jgi:hypothetical protein
METAKDKIAMIRLSEINDHHPDLIKRIVFECKEYDVMKRQSLRVSVSIQLHHSWDDEISWKVYQQNTFPVFRVAYNLESTEFHYYKMTYESFREERLKETKNIISEISSMVKNIPHDFEIRLITGEKLKFN